MNVAGLTDHNGYKKGGTGMSKKHKIMLCVLLASILVTNLGFAEEDAPGCRDHPLLTRMPNFYIQDCETKDFDQMDFVNTQGEDMTVEGKYYYISHYINEDVQPPSDLQILRNFINAIQKIGGVKISEGRYDAYLKVEKGDLITWVHVRSWNDGAGYDLHICEEKAMRQEVTADAKSMAQDISNTGKVALYGIYFDFNKADVKAESEPTLKEIANLLKQNSKLNLYVVGHTDNVGSLSTNMDLSQRRAEAVVQALVSKHGVDAKRLKAQGVGPLCPVASNKTEEGRAKNRRVELVEQ
jgi:outer membrane protein OmpA-like peptidoglycan-associated protein